MISDITESEILTLLYCIYSVLRNVCQVLMFFCEKFGVKTQNQQTSHFPPLHTYNNFDVSKWLQPKTLWNTHVLSHSKIKNKRVCLLDNTTKGNHPVSFNVMHKYLMFPVKKLM